MLPCLSFVFLTKLPYREETYSSPSPLSNRARTVRAMKQTSLKTPTSDDKVKIRWGMYREKLNVVFEKQNKAMGLYKK